MKILKFSGRAKQDKLVERSTECSAIEFNKSLEFTDIELYKLAKQYAELKTIAGYSNVSIREEYQVLFKETRQNT